MLEIESVHEIAGTVTLPPSPDLFTLAALTGFASGRPLTISPCLDRTTCGAWQQVLETCLEFTNEEKECRVVARTLPASEPLAFPADEMPYGDFLACMLLGRGHTLALSYAGEALLALWKNWCAVVGCTLVCETSADRTLVRLEKNEPQLSSAGTLAADDIHPVLGFFLGKKMAMTTRIDAPWISPLRQVLGLLGYPLACASNTPRPPADPIARRIAQMQQAARKQVETHAGFTLSADFSVAIPSEPLAVTLPGDDVLGAILIGAKSLVQRGNLVIQNMPAESWALQTLVLVRKMGCKIGEQLTGMTSFGQVGSLQLQRFDVSGRKTDCLPLFQYRSQLPIMVVIGAYATGQSIFRALQALHAQTPDGITQIHACLDIMGIRHGEMPDGIVLDGAKRYDGFDMNASLSPHLAGAIAVAALKCTGKSRINDEFILQRWPDFKNMLDAICKARE